MNQEKRQKLRSLNIEDLGVQEWDGNYTDQFGNKRNFIDDETLADQHLEEKQDVNITLRWYKSEIDLAKKIARKKGLKYQSYLKMVIKEALERDKKELNA